MKISGFFVLIAKLGEGENLCIMYYRQLTICWKYEK